MTSDLAAYSLRTVGITEHQWIALTATSLGSDSTDDMSDARAVNLKALHQLLTQPPPGIEMGTGLTWVEPYHDMKVTIHDTLVKQDLETGEPLEEWELAAYDIPYYAMNPEEN